MSIKDKDTQRKIEASVRANLTGEPKVMVIYEVEADATKRDDYWERVFVVAWQRNGYPPERSCGTHRVSINSKGESMLVWGHYDLPITAALIDARKRAGLTPEFDFGECQERYDGNTDHAEPTFQSNAVALELPDCSGDDPYAAVQSFIAQASQKNMWVYRVIMEDGSKWLVDLADERIMPHNSETEVLA